MLFWGGRKKENSKNAKQKTESKTAWGVVDHELAIWNFPSLVTPWATTLDPVPPSLAYSCTNVSRDLRIRAAWQSHFLPCLSISSVGSQGQETQQAKGLKSAVNQWPAVGTTLPLGLIVIEGSRIFEDNQQDLVVRSQATYQSPTPSLNPPSSFLPFIPPFLPPSLQAVFEKSDHVPRPLWSPPSIAVGSITKGCERNLWTNVFPYFCHSESIRRLLWNWLWALARLPSLWDPL